MTTATSTDHSISSQLAAAVPAKTAEETTAETRAESPVAAAAAGTAAATRSQVSRESTTGQIPLGMLRNRENSSAAAAAAAALSQQKLEKLQEVLSESGPVPLRSGSARPLEIAKNFAKDIYVVLLIIYLFEVFCSLWGYSPTGLMKKVGNTETAEGLLYAPLRYYVYVGTVIIFVQHLVSYLFAFIERWGTVNGVRTAQSASGGGGMMLGAVMAPRTAKHTRVGECLTANAGNGLDFVVSEMQGWRDAMEDAAICLPQLTPDHKDKSMFAVFDGHGGAMVAKLCAQSFPLELANHLKGGAEMGPCLTSTYKEMDRLLQSAGSWKKENGAPAPRMHFGPSGPVELPGGLTLERQNFFDFVGCTAVTVILHGKHMTIANAGDSRALLCRDGKCIELTRDHKPESPRERRRIEKAGGVVKAIGPCHRVDWGLNLSRALGDFAYKRDPDLPQEDQKISCVPDIVSETITEEDEFLVLACDGIFELLSSEQVVEFVRVRLAHNVPLPRIVESLLDEGCTTNPRLTMGRGTDNQTCIIVRLNSSRLNACRINRESEDFTLEDETDEHLINPDDGGGDVSFPTSGAIERAQEYKEQLKLSKKTEEKSGETTASAATSESDQEEKNGA